MSKLFEKLHEIVSWIDDNILWKAWAYYPDHYYDRIDKYVASAPDIEKIKWLRRRAGGDLVRVHLLSPCDEGRLQQIAQDVSGLMDNGYIHFRFFLEGDTVAIRTMLNGADYDPQTRLMMVSRRVNKFLEETFADVAENKALMEFKEEVAVNLAEKIQDYVSEGLSEDEAYQQAIATVGDIRDVYLARRQRPKAWGKLAFKGLILLVLASVLNVVWFWSRMPSDYSKFWHYGGTGSPFESVLINSDLVRIEYSARYQRGALGYAVYDSQGELIWERDFSRNDKGEDIVPVVNKGQVVIVARGTARVGGIRFRVHEVDDD